MALPIVEILGIGMKLVDKWFPDKAEAERAKLDLLKMQQEGEFKWLETIKESDAGQVAINVEEAKSDSIFKSGWRPYIGWVCGGAFSYQMVFRPVFSWFADNLWGWKPLPGLEMESLMTLTFGLLGLGAYRTYEKVRLK